MYSSAKIYLVQFLLVACNGMARESGKLTIVGGEFSIPARANPRNYKRCQNEFKRRFHVNCIQICSLDEMTTALGPFYPLPSLSLLTLSPYSSMLLPSVFWTYTHTYSRLITLACTNTPTYTPSHTYTHTPTH